MDRAARAIAEASQSGGARLHSRISGLQRKGFAVDGPVGRRKNASRRSRIERIIATGPSGNFLRLPRTVERDSGQLQPTKRIDGDENSGADSQYRNSGARGF